MLEACRIIAISKIELFIFSGTERVKPNEKKIKNHSNIPQLVCKSLFKQFQQKANIFFGFSLKT